MIGTGARITKANRIKKETEDMLRALQ